MPPAIDTARQRLARFWSGGCLALVLALTACGGGQESATGGTEVPAQTDCSEAGQRAWLRDYLADQYLWFDRMGTGDPLAATVDDYFRSLLAPSDPYSYSEPSVQFEQFYTAGHFTGYGYSLVWDELEPSLLRVRHVEPKSPVGLAGLRRGDIVEAIDGYTPQEVMAGTPARVSVAGVARAFRVRDRSGSVRELRAVSAEYPYVSVPASRVLEATVAGRRAQVGYLVYQQFVDGSLTELGPVFAQFAQAGIQELVLDLRYNGGGSIAVSRDLATLIGGYRLAGNTFARLQFNRLHPEQDEVYAFADRSSGIPVTALPTLQRVIVIASDSTASAAELLINGLRPFLEVVLIGATTYGKPYGFVPIERCGRTYSAVNFISVNALGRADFADGFAPQCSAPDDLDHALADPAEKRLATALHYLNWGQCPTSASARTGRTRAMTPAGSNWRLQGF